MFEKLQKIWEKEDLLKQALKTIELMLQKNQVMFKETTEALMKQKEMSFDIYKKDREINQYEMEIRKKILEHF